MNRILSGKTAVMDEFKTIIENTEAACSLCEKEFSHDEVVEIIKSENNIQKQICILKLDGVFSQAEADLLVCNLTNHIGIVREAAAVKFNELMQGEGRSFFRTDAILDTILDALVDINPNICRLVIEVLPYISNKKDFFERLYKRVVSLIDDAVSMNIRNRGYEYSRKVFKIFWYMEAVASLNYFENKKALKDIISRTYTFKDYTIREKTAKLLSLMNDALFSEIIDKLKNDENFFVRRFLFEPPAEAAASASESAKDIAKH
jgi:hypothetical protein